MIRRVSHLVRNNLGDLDGLRTRVRKRAGSAIIDGFFRGVSRAGRLHPLADPARHDITVTRDVAYRDGAGVRHRLDIYRPDDVDGPTPVVFYTHGGGFRILSKDTHWVMGLAYARRGYTVVVPNYRLAPDHPFPAAFEDSAAALEWTIDHAEELDLDLDRMIFAGESAGANLACSLTIACCYERPEEAAARIFERGVRPRVVLPACGMLQVSDTARIGRQRDLAPWVVDRLVEVEHAYLESARPHPDGGLDLADPLLFFERGDRPARPLPAFYGFCGTADPLLDDTRRLERALAALDAPVEIGIYPDEFHAFHAFVMRPRARQAWRDQYDFLERHL